MLDKFDKYQKSVIVFSIVCISGIWFVVISDALIFKAELFSIRWVIAVSTILAIFVLFITIARQINMERKKHYVR